ncbi:MAG: phosphatidylserine decarboxylase [Gammaproteobacteria bacterium]|nr:phosphatidylserine decarboxylase [Gammaproteobacteria bacterium]
MSRWFVYLQYILPQQSLSRVVGMLANARFGRTLFMRAFIRRYRVDMAESATTRLDQFENFNGFFTRALRPGCRPLAPAVDAILCPADGCISQLGAIDQDRIFQAKGHSYTTTELLGGDAALAQAFRNGSFATVYLSPRDYHRVHMPMAGTLTSMVYVPGKLFSVNEATAAQVPGLFARNERLVCMFDTTAGPMAVILVGAMIVAAIETVWCGQVCPGPQQQRQFSRDYRAHTPRLSYAAGTEMGRFKLGSTAIVLFPPGAVELDPALQAGSPVRMGQLLARQINNRKIS